MKFKKLGFTTQEGLSISNFEDGWSMEWGEGGSYHCNLTLNGMPVMEIYNEGNGGCVDYRSLTSHTLDKQVGDAVLAFLRRTNKDYQPDSKYDFCKNATEAGECEYGSIVENLRTEYERRKCMATRFKQGYKYVAFYDKDWTYTYVGGNSIPAIQEFAKSKKIEGKETIYTAGYIENKVF